MMERYWSFAIWLIILGIGAYSQDLQKPSVRSLDNGNDWPNQNSRGKQLTDINVQASSESSSTTNLQSESDRDSNIKKVVPRYRGKPRSKRALKVPVPKVPTPKGPAPKGPAPKGPGPKDSKGSPGQKGPTKEEIKTAGKLGKELGKKTKELAEKKQKEKEEREKKEREEKAKGR